MNRTAGATGQESVSDTQSGIQAEDGSTVTISYSNISGNVGRGIFDASNSGAVPAVANILHTTIASNTNFGVTAGTGTAVKLSDVRIFNNGVASRCGAPSCRSRTTTSDRMPAIPTCRPPRWCSSKRSIRWVGPTGPARSPEDRNTSQGGDCNRNSRPGDSRWAIQPHPWIGNKVCTGRLGSPRCSFL